MSTKRKVPTAPAAEKAGNSTVAAQPHLALKGSQF